MGMEVMRPKRGQQPTCDKPLRVRPSQIPSELPERETREATPTNSSSNAVLLCLGDEQQELSQSRILHPTTHSATRECGRALTRKPEADVLSDTKTPLGEKAIARAQIRLRMWGTQVREDVRVTPR